MATGTSTSGERAEKGATSESIKTSNAPSATRGQGPDAIALLKADHRSVENLFSQFKNATDDERKKQLALQICLELRVHTQIEEEIFYPASREVLKDEDMVDEAVVEHHAAKDLMDQIESMEPGDDLYDAKVTVLCEQIDHHVEEEENEYFPEVQKTDLDLRAIGQQLKVRKNELMDQMGGDQGRATH